LIDLDTLETVLRSGPTAGSAKKWPNRKPLAQQKDLY
jgi:hypothetical protein